jgi:hypothetical protein
MAFPSAHTPLELTAAASELLERHNYRRIAEADLKGFDGYRGRYYEDEYGVVSVVVYETWVDLVESWPEDQSRLVRLMSEHMKRTDLKAWDGYLVLLTPGSPPEEQRSTVEDIRYDVTRVRKLIAVGEDLLNLNDVERTLLPLLPIEGLEASAEEFSALDMLPGLLKPLGIAPAVTVAMVDAFREQQSLLERLESFDAQT